jgi:hypothetical protein
MPNQQSFCHLKPFDRLDGSVEERVTDDFYAAISVREEGALAPALSIFLNPGQLVALKVLCDQLVADMNTRVWKAAHPEEPTPVGPGQCDACGQHVPMLFERQVGEDRTTVNGCSTCAGVPADVLAELVAA